jgi:hypothetical protein
MDVKARAMKTWSDAVKAFKNAGEKSPVPRQYAKTGGHPPTPSETQS